VRFDLAMLLGLTMAASLATAESAKEGVQTSLAQVNAALQAGQADKARALLKSLPDAVGNSADAHNLRCRVLFTLEQFEAAKKKPGRRSRAFDLVRSIWNPASAARAAPARTACRKARPDGLVLPASRAPKPRSASRTPCISKPAASR